MSDKKHLKHRLMKGKRQPKSLKWLLTRAKLLSKKQKSIDQKM